MNVKTIDPKQAAQEHLGLPIIDAVGVPEPDIRLNREMPELLNATIKPKNKKSFPSSGVFGVFGEQHQENSVNKGASEGKAAAFLVASERRFSEEAAFLAAHSEEAAYPIHLFPETLRAAIENTAKKVQVPVGMAAQSWLACLSAAAQGHFNCRPPVTSPKPVSMFFLTFADSTDRKSSCDDIARIPLVNYQDKLHEDYSADFSNYEEKLTAWKIERKIIIREHTKPAKKSANTQAQESAKNPKQESLDNKLIEHKAKKPIKPRSPTILISEGTQEGIFVRHTQQPSLAMLNSEGVMFFDGHGMKVEGGAQGRMAGYLSGVWSDGKASITRVDEERSLALSNVRITVHLMVQPIVGKRAMAGDFLLKQGFLGRFLIYEFKSLAGTRFADIHGKKREDYNPKEDLSIKNAHAVIKKILDQPLPYHKNRLLGLDLKTIEIEKNHGALAWQKNYNDIEAKIGKGCVYADIKELAGRAAEQATRLAALFAIYEATEAAGTDDDGFMFSTLGAPEITANQINNAFKVISWYLDRRLECLEKDTVDPIQQTADVLMEWMSKKNKTTLTATDLTKNVPRSIRGLGNKKIRESVALLVDQEILIAEAHKGKKPVKWGIPVEEAAQAGGEA